MRPHTELVFRINFLGRKKRPCEFLVSWKKILWHDFLKRLFCVNWTPCAAANKTAMMSFPQWRSWQPWGISKQTDKCLVMLIWAPVIVIPIWVCLTATCHHNNTKCTTAPISDTVCLFPIKILSNCEFDLHDLLMQTTWLNLSFWHFLYGEKYWHRL